MPTPPDPEALRADQVSQNIEAIRALHERADQGLSRYQRPIETVGAYFGRPSFLYMVLCFAALWVLVHGLLPLFGVRTFDPAPFYWLQGMVSLSALVITTVVLITQNRQGRVAEQRAHLDLQVNLLAEQKIAKLIGLIEELRRDLPNVHNRLDAEAEAMEQATDPELILTALEETLLDPIEAETAETISDAGASAEYTNEEQRRRAEERPA